MALDKLSPQENTPRTLAEAHELLAGIRPRQKAPLEEWLAYYQRSAAVYAEVAEIDRVIITRRCLWLSGSVSS